MIRNGKVFTQSLSLENYIKFYAVVQWYFVNRFFAVSHGCIAAERIVRDYKAGALDLYAAAEGTAAGLSARWHLSGVYL